MRKFRTENSTLVPHKPLQWHSNHFIFNSRLISKSVGLQLQLEEFLQPPFYYLSFILWWEFLAIVLSKCVWKGILVICLSVIDEFQKFGSTTLKMHDGLFDSGTYSSSFSAPSATSSAPAAAGSAAAAAAAASIKAEEDHLDKDNQPQTTQYLNPSCVIFTYFSGDIASNVDDHFSRSLSDTQGSSKSGSPSWKGELFHIFVSWILLNCALILKYSNQ